MACLPEYLPTISLPGSPAKLYYLLAQLSVISSPSEMSLRATTSRASVLSLKLLIALKSSACWPLQIVMAIAELTLGHSHGLFSRRQSQQLRGLFKVNTPKLTATSGYNPLSPFLLMDTPKAFVRTASSATCIPSTRMLRASPRTLS